ncbi:hypothetical protein KBD49_14430 [Myxococcota bacterium]|jgi:biotin carboxyl carrier protein|nr:hypothetical protein [Myxococcota bacterium]
MSCKQNEVPVLPVEVTEAGNALFGGPGPREERRWARMEVRNGGDAALELVLEGADAHWVLVRVGEVRLALQVIARRDGQVLFRTPSGRILAPTVGPPGPLTEVSLGSRSFFVSPRSAVVPEGLTIASTGREVRARLPGRVVRVHAAPGDRVRRGDPLVVVEAMKMEDEVRSPRDGRIEAVGVREGQRVERDALLVTFCQDDPP